MANSYVEYSSGLTATTYNIPFNYISIDDVLVKGYNGSSWSDLTVASRDASAKTVTLDTAPSAYQKIRVYRSTSTAQLVDFQNGSRLSERDLDTAYQQGLFVAQEVSENASTVAAAGTSNVSLSGTTTVDDLGVTGNLKVDTIQDTTGTSAMTIDSDGNVGIGGTGAAAYGKFLVEGTGNVINANASSGAATLQLYEAGAGRFGITTLDGSAGAKFTTAGTERMRLSSQGNFLLGSGFDGFYSRQTTHFLGSNSMIGLTLWGDGGNGQLFQQFVNSSGNRIGSITQNGTSSTSYNTSSDYRLKENVVDITDGITRVKQLEPKKFNFIADAGTTVDGFIAHEAQAVVPEAVTGTKDEVDDEGNPVMQGIDQAKLVPVLTAALQEAIAKIEDLEARVTALES